MIDKELYPIKEFRADAGGMSHSQFYREVNAGRVRLTKIGRRSYVAKKDREAYFASLRTVGGSNA